MDWAKKILMAIILLCLLAGCKAEIAGPVPDYTDAPDYTSPHRRIPQSEHSLTGVISDVHLEVLKNSERLHIGDRSENTNDSLPAYEIAYTGTALLIRVYAQIVQNELWQDKLENFANQSPLIEAMTWKMGKDDLYAEFALELKEPILYRTWYYVNASFFTIEFTAKPKN